MPHLSIRLLLLGCAVSMLLGSGANAQDLSAAQVRFFETNIRPALVKYCYECHSVEAGDSRAGLLVDSRQGLLQGGDSGPAIVPGKTHESPLWEAINWEGYEMPPSEKMPASVIEKFKQWIEMGAPDPREREILDFKTKITQKDINEVREQHWAFRVPRHDSQATIDSLVEKKLQEEGLEAAAASDSYTLLRRIYFDLIGLPPTPAEILAFKSAYQKAPEKTLRAKVDELLARPQYGERWGRHWMDV
ncbi:MAG: DUF1549 domain-containing protein, partial [Planctomycetota bacterium]